MLMPGTSHTGRAGRWYAASAVCAAGVANTGRAQVLGLGCPVPYRRVSQIPGARRCWHGAARPVSDGLAHAGRALGRVPDGSMRRPISQVERGRRAGCQQGAAAPSPRPAAAGVRAAGGVATSAVGHVLGRPPVRWRNSAGGQQAAGSGAAGGCTGRKRHSATPRGCPCMRPVRYTRGGTGCGYMARCSVWDGSSTRGRHSVWHAGRPAAKAAGRNTRMAVLSGDHANGLPCTAGKRRTQRDTRA